MSKEKLDPKQMAEGLRAIAAQMYEKADVEGDASMRAYYKGTADALLSVVEGLKSVAENQA
jgi:hypothetical protein